MRFPAGNWSFCKLSSECAGIIGRMSNMSLRGAHLFSELLVSRGIALKLLHCCNCHLEHFEQRGVPECHCQLPMQCHCAPCCWLVELSNQHVQYSQPQKVVSLRHMFVFPQQLHLVQQDVLLVTICHLSTQTHTRSKEKLSLVADISAP